MKHLTFSLLVLIVSNFLFQPAAFAVDITSTRVLDSTGSVGEYTSITIASNGRLALSYFDITNGDLKLWVDDGRGGGTAGNEIADGTEIRTLDSTGLVGQYTSITLDSNGRLALSYFDNTNGDLKLWVDDGNGGGTAGNGAADGTEIRTLDSAGLVGQYTSITLDSNGRLALSYFDNTNGDLKLWVDDGGGGGTAGNAIADGTEIRTLDSAGSVGQYTSITLDSNGRLALSYFDNTNADLKLWVDDGSGGGTAGNAVADGTEIRMLDSTGLVGQYTSITLDSNGRLALSYFDNTNGDLKLWVDDGNGGGTAGNAIADGTEIRALDSTGLVGQNTSITLDSNGRLALSYLDITNGDLKLWVDDGSGGGTAGNAVADGTEIRTLDSTGLVGQHTSITLDSDGRLVLSYLDITNGDLKLAKLVEYDDFTYDPTVRDLSITRDANERLALSYYDFTNDDLKLWVDDGRGGGTAGNEVPDGTETRTIESAGDVGEYTSITLDLSGRLAISYYESVNDDLKLWVDDGSGGGTAGNAIADGTEIRTLDSAGFVGFYTSITLDTNGRVAISYYDQSNGNLKLWVDDGSGGGTAGNLVADGTEIRTLDSTGDVGLYTTITLDANDRLAVGYYDFTNGDLKVWVDDGRGGGTAGNGVADGTEIRTQDSTGAVGEFPSIIVDSNDRLALSYFDQTNGDLKLWVDDGRGGGTAGNGVADGTELRTIDSAGSVGTFTSITLDSNQRLAVSYYDGSNSDLKLWVDDGRGGGTAGNGVADGTETRTLDSTGNVGDITSITLDADGELVVSYRNASNGDLKLLRQVRNFPDLETRGNGVSIANADSSPVSTDDTDFGSQLVAAGTITKVFTLENLGGEPLVLGSGSVSLSGPGAADFTITAAPFPILRSGKTSTFTVMFDPSVAGQRTATVSIANNTLSETPFTFAIQGLGEEPTPTAAPTVSATPTVVPTTSATATPSVTPTAIASATPVNTPTQLFSVSVISRGPQRGLGALKLSQRNATSSNIGVRSCLPAKKFIESAFRDYFLVLRNQDGTHRRSARVRRTSKCHEFSIGLRGNYRIRFEQVRGKSVVRASEEVVFGVR